MTNTTFVALALAGSLAVHGVHDDHAHDDKPEQIRLVEVVAPLTGSVWNDAKNS